MTPTDHDVDSVDGDERTGLNRRQMIKAAGIAGAAAWAAPMIIDSLSSPAAAVTHAPGCFRFSISATSSCTNPVLNGAVNNCQSTTLCGGTTATNQTSGTLNAQGVSGPSTCANGASVPFSFNIISGYSCTFVGFGVQSSSCHTSNPADFTITNGAKTVNVVASHSFTNYTFVISCG